jgi:hypothetical protein
MGEGIRTDGGCESKPQKTVQFGQTPGDIHPGSPFKRRRLVGHVDTGLPPGRQAGRPPSSPGPRPPPRRCQGTWGRWPSTPSKRCPAPPAAAPTTSPQQAAVKRDHEWTASRWPPSCGTQWGTAPTPSSSRRRPNEHGFAHRDNWLIKPVMAHPPSTVWDLHNHPDLLPSLGGRDLPDGSAAPLSSPLLGAPGKGKEDENIALESKPTQSSLRTLPRGTSATLPGSSATLSERRVKEGENHHEGWKIEEDKKKKQKTYLLVPEPEASP